jgi:3-hydroxyacyl-CoA dehydrogenase
MTNTIQKVAVIGAGSMGAGIASHFANVGIPVVLLDRISTAGTRSAIAEDAVQRQLATGGFMHPSRTALIRPGNIEDDFSLIADADWIIEAIIENVEAKRQLYQRIDAIRKDGSIVSSNTSTIPLAHLTKGLGARFASDFLISHFFNPPRHMKLLEIVTGPKTSVASAALARRTGDIQLGKTVIDCRDTPGFIANRIGNYWMSVAALEAMRLGLTVEEADAVMSKPFGIPRTGIFGLFDLVGVNLVPLVWRSLLSTLPERDDHHNFDLTTNPFIARMLSRDLIGRKGKGGFYRHSGKGLSRLREVIDFHTGEYRPEQPATINAFTDGGHDLRRLCDHDSVAGRYAWRVLSSLVRYAAAVAPSIANDITAIDMAMQLGYNWTEGPFKMADRVGLPWLVQRILEDGDVVPPLLNIAVARGGFYNVEFDQVLATDGSVRNQLAKEGVLFLADIKRKSRAVAKNDSASLWNIGEGVLALEIHTKMNACNLAVIEMVETAIETVQRDYRALVVGNDHLRAFSAGADLSYFVAMLEKKDWTALEQFVKRGQKAFLALKYAPFPVVAAAFGLTLGGGAELLMHCNAAVAHGELHAGLPELNVGIVPGWGGCTQLAMRLASSDSKGVIQAFKTAVSTQISTSALEAVEMGFLRREDEIIMNRDRLLAKARARAVSMIDEGYRPRPPQNAMVLGSNGVSTLLEIVAPLRVQGALTENDWFIVEEMATIFTGGENPSPRRINEEEMTALERHAFLRLAARPETLARMKHMLATGKPLRN